MNLWNIFPDPAVMPSLLSWTKNKHSTLRFFVFDKAGISISDLKIISMLELEKAQDCDNWCENSKKPNGWNISKVWIRDMFSGLRGSYSLYRVWEPLVRVESSLGKPKCIYWKLSEEIFILRYISLDVIHHVKCFLSPSSGATVPTERKQGLCQDPQQSPSGSCEPVFTWLWGA